MSYYNYRYYDPQVGRWLSRDPIGEKDGNNLYRMCANNSVKWWDYLGLADWWNPLDWPGFTWDAVTTSECEEVGGNDDSGDCCCEGFLFDPSAACCEKGDIVMKIKVTLYVRMPKGHDWWYSTISLGMIGSDDDAGHVFFYIEDEPEGQGAYPVNSENYSGGGCCNNQGGTPNGQGTNPYGAYIGNEGNPITHPNTFSNYDRSKIYHVCPKQVAQIKKAVSECQKPGTANTLQANYSIFSWFLPFLNQTNCANWTCDMLSAGDIPAPCGISPAAVGWQLGNIHEK